MSHASKPSPTPDFRTLFESAPGLCLVLTPALTIVAVSDAYLCATGTKREEILGRHIFEVFPDHGDDLPATGLIGLRASLERVLQNRVTDVMAMHKCQFAHPQSKAGEVQERYWRAVNSPVLGEKQQVLYVIHSVQDVSEFTQLRGMGCEQQQLEEDSSRRRKQRSEQSHLWKRQWKDANSRLRDSEEKVARLQAKAKKLEQLKAELFAKAERAMAAGDRLAATSQAAAVLAHEINNPIMAVSNVLYLLHANGSLDESAQGLLTLAEQELGRVGQLTQQALKLSRGKGTPKAVRLSAVVADLLKLYAKNIERGQIRVEARYEFKGELQLDAGAIRQVLTNLLLNAVEALPKQGLLRLHVYETRGWRDGNRRLVRIVVADNGAGIAPKHRDKLFEPFFTTKGARGTGLGLWVTRSIIVKMDGSLRCRTSTRLGRSGTCFAISLPLEARN